MLLLGAERVDDAGWVRLHAALKAGDPNDEVRDCWWRREDPLRVRHRGPRRRRLLDDAIAWCTDAESGPELRRLAKMLRRWRTEIVAHHTTGVSNCPVEAPNLLIKAVKRSGRGFRKMTSYRLRLLLAGGRRPCDAQPVASIRPRRPRLFA